MKRDTAVRAVLGGLGAGVLSLGLAGAAAGESKVAFRFEDQRITESSGLAQSLGDANLVWTHNDSGDAPRIYGVDNRSGRTVATLDLTDAPARDWEGMATCRDGAEATIWVGDIGDNIDAWKTYRLLAVNEPAAPRDGAVDFTRYDVQYGDGKARDAEALLCHPTTGRLYLVSKEAEGGVFQGPSALRRGQVNRFAKIASAPSTVTDGVFLADGRHAVLRGYRQAWVVDVENGWKVVATFYPPLQIQGETVALAADGRALLFGSEGLNASVYRVDLPADLGNLQGTGEDLSDTQPTPDDGRPAAGPSRSATPLDSPPVANEKDSDGIPGVSGPWIAVLSAVGLGGLALTLASRRD
ncbi:MAG: WD40 repeat domain-containing protein [Sporichthyaceae bacterium]